MRKQMKLNQETAELLKYYKKTYYDKECYNATYTFIVNRIIEDLSNEIHLIDWELIKNTKSNKAPKNDKYNTIYVTTLNLTNSSEKVLNCIQKEIRTQFNIARVYIAYAVKSSVKAHYLKNIQNIDIYKK